MKNSPIISIVIATRNEEKNIGRCLASLAKQNYRNFEIIVVDKRSSDKTASIVKRYADVVLLPHTFEIKNPRGSQLNLGVSKSRGEIIFFPDADMTFDTDLLKNAIDLIVEGADALYVPETIMGKGFFGKVRNFERSFYNGTLIDGIRIVKKKLFLGVGGFDEKNIKFGPDDWDFTKRVKKETERYAITQSKIYHHEENLSLSKYLSKKSKYNNTFDDYIKKWGKDDPDIKMQLGFRYRFFKVFTENGKWKKLFIHPVLSLGMYFIRLLVGINYLRAS